MAEIFVKEKVIPIKILSSLYENSIKDVCDLFRNADVNHV